MEKYSRFMMTARVAAIAVAASCAILAGSLAGAGSAHATGEIVDLMTPSDKARLGQYETARSKAFADAASAGQSAEFDAIMSGMPVDVSAADISGDWKCRTIKTGRFPEYVSYSWFRCRISDDGSGWRLEKLTGSQRMSGRFFTDSDKRMIYLGTLHYADEKPSAYPRGDQLDQVAYAVLLDDGRMRLEFPKPHLDSEFDVLELRR
ncbi:MAG: DUF4893 domain-containing protein [Nitratireductor sp.]|nr:DUF4893 domain-containing protein [Nitratireductor sp.]